MNAVEIAACVAMAFVAVPLVVVILALIVRGAMEQDDPMNDDR